MERKKGENCIKRETGLKNASFLGYELAPTAATFYAGDKMNLKEGGG